MKPTLPYSTLLVIALAIAKTIEVAYKLYISCILIWLHGKGWFLVGLGGLRLG